MHAQLRDDGLTNPVTDILPLLPLGASDAVSETWDLLLNEVYKFTNVVERFSEVHNCTYRPSFFH
jgi:hypothetical protein